MINFWKYERDIEIDGKQQRQISVDGESWVSLDEYNKIICKISYAEELGMIKCEKCENIYTLAAREIERLEEQVKKLKSALVLFGDTDSDTTYSEKINYAANVLAELREKDEND